MTLPRHVLSRPGWNRKILADLEAGVPAALDWVTEHFPFAAAVDPATVGRELATRDDVAAGEALAAHAVQQLVGAIEARYPVPTAGAVAELRGRGIEADEAVLNYVVRSREIPEPKRAGRVFRWCAADIDRAAEHLAAMEYYTPEGWARAYFALDADQHEALKPGPGAMLVAEILPGADNLGVPALITYRPMTAEEAETWERRAEEAKG